MSKPAGTPAGISNVYTPQFWLVCLSSLLFFASFNMIIPELPGYLTKLGGAEYKGLIIALFTLTAMLSRPFSGKMADRVGRIPVMMLGSVVCFAVGFVYPLTTTVSGFLLLRLVHGFSTGFTPTGLTAYLSDVIPAQRRGEAMGILGTAGTVGMALGPAIGGFVALLGFDFLFYTSSMCAFLSAAILLRLRETLPVRHKVSIDLLKIHKRDVFEPRVWATCVVMALSAYMYGTVFTVLPDFGDFVGIRNKGILFTYLTVASLLVRLVAGRASDYFGRVFVLKVSTAIIAVASIVIGFATTPVQLIGGILLYGAGQGMTSPTVFAWATDLSDENFRGRALSTLYIFMELGIGLGALVGGLFFGSNPAHLPVTFLACCLLACVAFAYLFTIRTKQPATT